jgi:hypothetical protein
VVVWNFSLYGKIAPIVPQVVGYRPALFFCQLLPVDDLLVFPTHNACAGGENKVVYREVREEYLFGRIEVTAGGDDAETIFLSCLAEALYGCLADFSFARQYGAVKIGDDDAGHI